MLYSVGVKEADVLSNWGIPVLKPEESAKHMLEQFDKATREEHSEFDAFPAAKSH